MQKQMNNARHEYRKIITARKNCAQLAGESETCVGEFAVYSGDTDVQLDVNTTLVGSERLALGVHMVPFVRFIVRTVILQNAPVVSVQSDATFHLRTQLPLLIRQVLKVPC